MESLSFGLTCPDDIKRFAERAKNYTTITWSEVEATDNSGVTPTVTVTGVRRMYYVGKHLIVYKARDEARNFKLCQFHVTIEGKSKVINLVSSAVYTVYFESKIELIQLNYNIKKGKSHADNNSFTICPYVNYC